MLHALRSRLSLRLASLFLLASLVPALGIGVMTLAHLERSVERDSKRRLDLLAEVVEDLLGDAIAGAEEKLTTVARLLESELAEREVGVFSEENASFRDTVLARLEALVEPAETFLELQVFAAAGGAPSFVGLAQQMAVAQGKLDFPGVGQRNLENAQSNLRAPIVQAPLTTRVPHREDAVVLREGFATLGISRPIAEPGGGSGALVAYVDFSALAATLARLAGDGAALRVVDREGTLLAAAGDASGDAAQRIVRMRTVGEDARAPAGWRIEVSESAERVREPIERLRLWLASGFGLAALVALALSLAFSSHVTRPISALRRAAQAMELGDLKARSGIRGLDEIGTLGAAFDSMAAALERLDEAKSQFLGNVSHELRTPLTSLRLSVGNLLDGVTGEVAPAQREVLERVRRELTRLSTLVDDLLELARLEAGGAAPRMERVELPALARDCLEAMAPRAAERGVRLSLAGTGHARADPAMLRRVLWNLIDNGIKFTPAGGTVRVLVSDGALEVSDDGPGGVPKDAFERFRQGTRGGAKPEGVGLGLAIVAELVALQGGSIEVAEGAPHGTVFRVRLEGAG
jgi:signal transduction histidine kinase